MRVKEFSHPITAAPEPGPMVLVELPVNYIPYAVLGLEPYKLRVLWASDEDYSRGYNHLCDFQRRLAEDMSSSIVEAINRVYMAIRQLSVGEAFSLSLEGAPPVLPAVPPSLDVDAPYGILGQIAELPGFLPGGWFGVGTRRATLADVVNALRQGSQDEASSLLDKLDLLGDVGDVSGIYNVVRGTVADAAEVTEAGGILAVLVVSAMSQIAAAQLAAGQMAEVKALMERLVSALDGGGILPPDGNVLEHLANIDTQIGG